MEAAPPLLGLHPPGLTGARPPAGQECVLLAVEPLDHERGLASEHPEPRTQRAGDRGGPEVAADAGLVLDRDEDVVVGRAAAAVVDLAVDRPRRAGQGE